MKVEIQTIVRRAAEPDLVAWGQDPKTGEPMMLIRCGSQQIMVTLDVDTAHEVGAQGIFAARSIAQARAEKEARRTRGGALLSLDGLPIVNGKG